ncbi:MAG: CPBP family intramembrane glutamic endopeptidase, partial [Kineosporiaceae bacterium]
GAFVAAAVLPDADGLTRSLIASVGILVFAVVVARAVAVRSGGWSAIGLTHPREWRDTRLLVVPALISFVPLLGGVRSIDGGALAILITGYVLTGFMEETLWRGAALRILAPTGTAEAVWVGSALFGASHLTNVLFRDSVALVAAQAFGAFCFGVGYAALRFRTNTIWPLMVLHFTTDLFAAVGGLPKIPVLVAQDVVLLALGAFLIRRGRVSE